MARFITFKAFASNMTTSRRPRSPSSNHNVKEPFLERISIMPETQHRPQDCARRAAWARCIGGQMGACQTQIAQKTVIFCRPVDRLGKHPPQPKSRCGAYHPYGARRGALQEISAQRSGPALLGWLATFEQSRHSAGDETPGLLGRKTQISQLALSNSIAEPLYREERRGD